MKFEEALKELSENQQEIKKTLSAIEGLLHQRLEKRAKGALQAPILSLAAVSDKILFASSTPAQVRVIPSINHSVSTLQSMQLSHTPASSTSPGNSTSLSSVSQTESSSPPLPLIIAGGNTMSVNSEDDDATGNSSSLANYNGPIPKYCLCKFDKLQISCFQTNGQLVSQKRIGHLEFAGEC